MLHITTKPNRITSYNVDNGPGPPSEAAGSGESDLDVEQAGALAPDANIVVYPAPDTEGGYADAFFAAASQNLADTVSSSWGESETLLQASAATGGAEPAYAQAFDEAFLEMAAQDQSTFVAAGDAGAYDAAADLGTTNLSVGSPDDSPFVTSVGGTTLGGTITAATTDGTVKATIPAQRTWGWDWLWPDYAAFGFPAEASFAARGGAGGGGGFSSYEPLPLYQSMLDEQNSPGAGSYSAVPYLTPADYGNIDNLYLPTQWNFEAKPAVVTGQGTGRGLPDLVTDADPFTGYLLYDPLASPALQGGWGGTSFGAAQLNGARRPHRPVRRPPRRAMEPGHLLLRAGIRLAVHPAEHLGPGERQPLLHRHARPGLQPRLRPRLPGPGQAGRRLRLAGRGGARSRRAGECPTLKA